MGNFICMTKKETKDIGSRSKRVGRSQRKLVSEEELHLQALSMALQQHQLSQRFEGSMSRRIGASKRHAVSESFSANKQVHVNLENIQIKKFVLIHGEGFGAWCWYKTVALLEEAGLLPVALDLTGSGIDLTDTNRVTTLAEYSKPLTVYLENLPEDEKVILVGHSIGGACISYALEHYAQKISKAIFLCATMVSDGQRPFDVFADELGSAERFIQESKFLIHGNGKEKPPTGFMFEKEQMKGLYFNQSPAKDVALAMVSMRHSPLGPIMEKLSLSAEKYGTGRRFYIQTLDDHALSPDVQEKLVRENPPEGVFKIKGSDHSPFFSKPQSLHKLLVEIAQIP
ncbi:putative methylesterase 12, chloroplastic [Cajanus cajan]|uniref:Esterase At1g33990 family n=1 Tax=Cajanus cajan TaxID=3821 RepID=A0A151RFN5_CAJCA|nr:putative methylesterase 12, chloroplastic [Cajanus cajan]KYP41309.1 putative esterase At1g33990 family [Cajanus cajan]